MGTGNSGQDLNENRGFGGSGETGVTGGGGRAVGFRRSGGRDGEGGKTRHGAPGIWLEIPEIWREGGGGEIRAAGIHGRDDHAVGPEGSGGRAFQDEEPAPRPAANPNPHRQIIQPVPEVGMTPRPVRDHGVTRTVVVTPVGASGTSGSETEAVVGLKYDFSSRYFFSSPVRS